MRRAFRFLALGCCLVAPLEAAGQTTNDDLKRLTLEELLNVDVTTVSRGPEPIMSVPAAVYVITNDEIRRSGARTIPDVLRLAPGLQVARINAGTWAVGVRGFADRLARSMLVLIDGRAVYSPLFAGTYWETQDTLLEDVERIEIIGGPGGTLWGANAVNGIINIITTHASETTGVLGSVGGGNQERGFGAFRLGRSAGSAWHYRVYGKAIDHQAERDPTGHTIDGLQFGQGGFRADWSPSLERSVTIEGDLYVARLGQRTTITTTSPPFAQTTDVDSPLSGGSVLTRWVQSTGRGRWQVQAFYARTNRDERPVAENRDTVDLDVQHTPRPFGRHQLRWGGGYRVSTGRIDAVPPTSFEPPRRTDRLFTGFVQDELTVVPARVRVLAGSKIEHNDYSGGELQPSVRLLWTPTHTRTFWTAVTRAVRTPSRVETDYSTTALIDPGLPLFVRLMPNQQFKPEKLVAYEVGSRHRVAGAMYVSVAGFYNRHTDVLATEPSAPIVETAPTRLILPLEFRNGLEGHSYGAELLGDLRPRPWWRVTGTYSYLRIQLSRQPESLDVSQERRNEGASPRHQVHAQSSFDLGRRWTADAFVRYVSALHADPVPAYVEFNARVGWRVTPRVELSFVGQDLGHDAHAEWSGGASTSFGIRRRASVALTWIR